MYKIYQSKTIWQTVTYCDRPRDSNHICPPGWQGISVFLRCEAWFSVCNDYGRYISSGGVSISPSSQQVNSFFLSTARALKGRASLSGLPYCLWPSACGFYVATLRGDAERRRSGPGWRPCPRLYSWCPFRAGSAKAAEKRTGVEPFSRCARVLHAHSETTAHLPHTRYGARVYCHAIILFSPFLLLHIHLKMFWKKMPALLFFPQLEPPPYRGPSDSDPPPYSEHA